MTLNGYSPSAPDVLADPFPYYAELRARGGAYYAEAEDIWVISRYDDVDAAIRNPAVYSSKALWALFGGKLTAMGTERGDIRAFADSQPKSMITMDPPDHIPIRRLAAKMFTPRAIGGYSTMVREICERLADDLVDQLDGGEIDLVEAYHRPLPILVIAAVLGIPPQRSADFVRWSDALMERQKGRRDDPTVAADIKEMVSYFNEQIAHRTTHRSTDLISLIITQNEAAGSFLDGWDIFNFCALLLTAGNETTTHLFGNLFNAFFENPDQFDKAWTMSDFAPVTEEILRYESTAQAVIRLTNEQVDVDGTTIPRDSLVLVTTGSGNRDERYWDRPEQFDVERPGRTHFGFGAGIHHCIGAHLARLEMNVGLDVLRSRIARVEPVETPERVANMLTRGFHRMPVTIKAR